jgi:RHS repeat-associated protein
MKNQQQREKQAARISIRAVATLVACWMIPMLLLATAPVPVNKPASYPAWWFEREVIRRTDTNVSTPNWTNDYPLPNDYAALNQGQLKAVAKKAYDEMRLRLPSSAWTNAVGSNLMAVTNGFSSTNGNYQAANLGQLKAVAKPFYAQLLQIRYTNAYPWTGNSNALSSTNANDFAVANLGQVKKIFSFNLTAPTNQFPGWWERYRFGTNGVDPDVDSDHDGRTNWQEFLDGTDPNDFFNGESPEISIVSGNNQIGDSGVVLPQALTVAVRNAAHAPWTNASVSFNVSQGNGRLWVGTNSLTNWTQVTGTNGWAAVNFAPGSTSVVNRVKATVLYSPSAPAVSFSAYAGSGWGTNAAPDPGGDGAQPTNDVSQAVWDGSVTNRYTDWVNNHFVDEDDIDASHITLTWTPPVAGISAFRVEHKIGTNAWTNLTTVASTVTNLDVTGLQARERRQYRVLPVTATNVVGAPTPPTAYLMPLFRRVEYQTQSAEGGNGAYLSDDGTNYLNKEVVTTGGTGYYVATPTNAIGEGVSWEYDISGYEAGPTLSTHWSNPYDSTDLLDDVISCLDSFDDADYEDYFAGIHNPGWATFTLPSWDRTGGIAYKQSYTLSVGYYHIKKGKYRVTLNPTKATTAKWLQIRTELDDADAITVTEKDWSVSASATRQTSAGYEIDPSLDAQDYSYELGEAPTLDVGMGPEEAMEKGVAVSPSLGAVIGSSGGGFSLNIGFPSPYFPEAIHTISWTESLHLEVWGYHNATHEWVKLTSPTTITWSLADGYNYSLAFRVIGTEEAEDNESITLTLNTSVNGTDLPSSSSKFFYNDPPSLNIPADEASGALYRKIALNGRPLPDSKPQQAEESDQQAEETFIDALTLGLRHSTTDIYIPVAGSEMSLAVRRNTQSQIWNLRGGLRPHERPDLPFGVAWNSNLGANIRFEAQTDELAYAYVTDENGATYRFASLGSHNYFPFPTAAHEQAAYLTQLTFNGSTGKYTFSRKFGSSLVYEMTTIPHPPIPVDREAGSSKVIETSYARLISVTDRLGQVVNYSFPATNTLIPSTITVPGRPDQTISIRQENMRVKYIWDAKGNKTEYVYTYDSGYNVHKLMTVIAPDGTETNYDYDFDTEVDQNLLPVNQTHVTHIHCDVDSIEDANGNTFGFQYAKDVSKWDFKYDQADGLKGYYRKTGLPRCIETVTLPEGLSSHFENQSTVKLTKNLVGDGLVLTEDSIRQVEVTDAAGKVRTYQWGGAQVKALNAFRDLLDDTHISIPSIVYYTTMTIDYGSSRTETFTFDPAAALALKSVTDLSGNTTSYVHGDAWTAPTTYRSVLPTNMGLNLKFEDPTSQTNALGHVKSFTYHATNRIMTSVTDEEGRKTEYALDGLGRRTNEMVYTASSALVQRTDFAYGNTNFPGFMTKKTVVGSGGDANLVTDYVPDSVGRVQDEIVDPSGLELTTSCTYDVNGNKEMMIDPLMRVTSYQYDKRNRLALVVYPDGASKHFVYDSRGNKVKEIDENGHATILVYDGLNRVTEQVRDMNGNEQIDSSDLKTVLGYNAVNSRTSQKDPRGYSSIFQYNDLQLLVTNIVTRPRSGLTNSYIPTVANDYVSTFEYDFAKNAGGSVFASSDIKPTKTIDPRGYVQEATYDAVYRSTSSKMQYQLSPALYTSSTNTYDHVGNLKASVDPLGKRTEIDYDALNRPTVTRFAVATPGTTNSAYGYAQNYYTSTGLKWKVRDEEGRETTTVYDGAGRPTEVHSPTVDNGYGSNDSAVTESEYDEAGNVVAQINPLGQRWEYSYDARNRKTNELAPFVFDAISNQSKQPSTVTVYDNVGNPVQEIDARGQSTWMVYDAANRLTHTVTPVAPVLLANNSETELCVVQRTTYDGNGNAIATYRGGVSSAATIVNASNPSGVSLTETVQTADNTFDELNRLIETIDAENIGVDMEYDAAGNKTSVLDGKGQKTRFEYDGLNRNTVVTHPAATGTATTAGLSETFAYDAVNKTGRVDGRSQQTTYGYDDRHRLTSVTYVSRTQDNRTYTYDKVGNLLTATEADSSKAGKANVVYTYDVLNRQATETSGGIQHEYKYDLAGNRVKVTYDLGGTARVMTCEYDDLNRLTLMTEGGRETATTYDLNGNVVTLTQPNGDVTQKSYDTLNRMLTLVTRSAGWVPLSRYTQQYDLASNVRKVVEDYGSGGLTDRIVLNTYDAINRLLVEAATTGATTVTTTYVYDNAHNRSSKVVTGGAGAGTTTYGYNNLNQMTQIPATGTATVSYTYDNNGNRATQVKGGQTDTYSYDYENRLVQLQKNITGTGLTTGTYTYLYDYGTRRVERNESSAGGALTKLIFSGGISVREYQSSTLQVEYIRGSDYGGGVGGILYTLRSGIPSYNHYNSRGDVTAKSDGSGAVTYEAAYEAFGKRTVEQGTTVDRQKANTKDEDPTGLLNEGFRYRDLETGSFITRDPLGFVDGPNMYSYVVQNPWTKFDPFGLEENKTESVWDWAKRRANTAIEITKKEGPATGSALYNWIKQTGSELWHEAQNIDKAIKDPRSASGGMINRTMKNASGTYQAALRQLPLTPEQRGGQNLANYQWNQMVNHGGNSMNQAIHADPNSIAYQSDFSNLIAVASMTPWLWELIAAKTGTVWDSIKATQPLYEGTAIPRSFEMATANGKVWVHGNATEHMAEYATSMLNRGVSPTMVNVGTQAQMTSLQSAVNAATANGVTYGKLLNVGGWELKFGAPQQAGQLPALIHALPK